MIPRAFLPNERYKLRKGDNALDLFARPRCLLNKCSAPDPRVNSEVCLPPQVTMATVIMLGEKPSQSRGHSHWSKGTN